MITERFLNACFSLILNEKCKVRKTKALYRDLIEILDFTESKETIDVEITVRNKLECLRKIIELLNSGKTLQSVIESVTWGEKFKQYVNFIETKMEEDISEEQFQEIIRQVRLRKKVNALFKNYDDISFVIDSIKDGSFDSIDDLLEDYEVTIKKLYSNIMETNRALTIEAAASLDLVKDDYDHVIEMIVKKYSKKNTTPTGFPAFDGGVMYGGYEPSRLYIFGGGSGAGKSTFLNNTIVNSAIMRKNLDAKPGEIKYVYLYVTLENTIEEALMRTYQPLFDKTQNEVLEQCSRGVDMKDRLMQYFANCNSTIIMKYFPPMSISAVDLMGVIDEAVDEYGKESIAGLYIDYLDLLKTDTKYDLYRLELGHIALALKTLAVQYNIPIITGSQLGRDVYKVKSAKDLGVYLMSESIKKVEHADFIALFAKDLENDSIIHGKVGKNRSGKSNVSLKCGVDFGRYKFLSIDSVSNKGKPDKTTKSGSITYEGMSVL